MRDRIGIVEITFGQLCYTQDILSGWAKTILSTEADMHCTQLKLTFCLYQIRLELHYEIRILNKLSPKPLDLSLKEEFQKHGESVCGNNDNIEQHQ